MKLGVERCESPIERSLAKAFPRVLRGFQPRMQGAIQCELGRWPDFHILLLAQPDIGRFSPDFLVVPDMADHSLPWGVVIEADGHDFHERTKEQAKHDKSRDRSLSALGLTILRFTGSEIWNNAEGCAAEAMAVAIKLQRQRLLSAFDSVVIGGTWSK